MSVTTNLRGCLSGLDAAAHLMRAVGGNGSPVWSQLTPVETRAISERMNTLSSDSPMTEQEALAAFLAETAGGSPRATAQAEQGIWARLAPAHAGMLAALVRRESPTVAGWIMTRLDARLAAIVVRMLDDEVSLSILQRILKLTPPPADVRAVIESSLEATLSRLQGEGGLDGHERVARIFDQLETGPDARLLDRLEDNTPGSGERIRALMFTFDDLVALSAAALQTLLTRLPRETLVVALKGAREDVANAFFSNLTKRAGALIREEVGLLGPVRRVDIDEARREVVEMARALIRSGDIRLGEARDDDELVE